VSAQADRGQRFRALHEGEPFVIPNPWDAGSARVLEGLGFRALATSSSAFAFTLGRSDGAVTLAELGAHVETIAAATELPVSVDLEHGYGPTPADTAVAIGRAASAGAVGGSIEDWDPAGRLYDLDEATERVAAAVASARSLPFPFTLTARAENHIRGNPDLDDTIARLKAYEAEGADVLYAPGLRTTEEIRAVCSAVGRPVNVLARRDLSFADIAGAGAQRISLGGALAWVGVSAVAAVAEAIRDRGDFSGLGSGADAARLLG
jgi:2-methylisocitrate lyase-like PEP mutase family enzyme